MQSKFIAMSVNTANTARITDHTRSSCLIFPIVVILVDDIKLLQLLDRKSLGAVNSSNQDAP